MMFREIDKRDIPSANNKLSFDGEYAHDLVTAFVNCEACVVEVDLNSIPSGKPNTDYALCSFISKIRNQMKRNEFKRLYRLDVIKRKDRVFMTKEPRLTTSALIYKDKRIDYLEEE